jgi:hypothetical protein
MHLESYQVTVHGEREEANLISSKLRVTDRITTLLSAASAWELISIYCIVRQTRRADGCWTRSGYAFANEISLEPFYRTIKSPSIK